MQTQWIADHSTEDNIQFVIHMGDMTHRNTINEWMVADDAHEILDAANIPYSVIPGNHDYPGSGAVDTASVENYSQYFGTSRFANKSWYGGSYENKNANNYCFFSSGTFKFMVISLEFAPSKQVLCWADQLISSHPDHNIILATHCYQRSNTSYTQNCNTTYNVTGSSGDDIWNELARRHSNVLFVFSGHIGDTGYRTKTGNGGNCIHEILTDYQLEKWQNTNTNYGNGWMRKLKFTPSIGTVDVESFSVIPGINTFNNANYNSNPEHQDHKFTIQNTYLTPSYTRTQLSNTFNDLTVNTVFAGDQLKAEVASAANGDFVVVWEDDRDGNGFYQINARGFYVDGCEKFSPITINQKAAGQQLKPHIDMNSNGDFVVVWEDDNDTNNKYNILAAGFDQFGVRRFDDIAVHSNLNGQHFTPRVGVQDNGNFLVVWQDDADENGFYQIQAAGFNADASTKTIPDFTVNQIANGQQLNPDIAMSPNGKYVIVWEDDSDGNNTYQLLGAGFDAVSNTRLFPDITINGIGAGQQMSPKVSIDQNEVFTVVWEDDNDNDGQFQILAAHFNSSGQKIGTDFIVKPDQTGQLKHPEISKNNSGDYVISWQDDSDGNELFQINAKGYKQNNSLLFDERTINEDGTGQQIRPVVSFSDNQQYIVVWEDDIDEDGKWQLLANGHDLQELTPPSESCNPSCRDVLHFSASQSIDSLYEARQTIHSTAVINETITYSAGECVSLNGGFVVSENTTFLAKIEGCN